MEISKLKERERGMREGGEERHGKRRTMEKKREVEMQNSSLVPRRTRLIYSGVCTQLGAGHRVNTTDEGPLSMVDGTKTIQGR